MGKVLEFASAIKNKWKIKYDLSLYPIEAVFGGSSIFGQISGQLGQLGALNQRDRHEVEGRRHVLHK